MSPTNLETYPTWNSEPLALPPRTPLYHLVPLGVGTPLVESLASYIARLAQAHHVSSVTLVNEAIRPFALKQLASPLKATLDSNSTYKLNGVGAWATTVVQSLQLMTGYRHLRPLTMVSWRYIFAENNLLRHTRAWCPACYEQARQTHTVIYDPLVWSLAPVTHCPRHGQALHDRCPQPECQRTLPCISRQERLGYCPYCQAWLGHPLAHPAASESARLTDEHQWSIWVTQSLAELVAEASNLTPLPSVERLAEVLMFLATHLTDGNLSALARRFGLTSLYRFQRAACIPQIGHLLDLCYHLGLSPLQLLTQPLAQIDLTQLKPPSVRQLRQRWSRSRKPDQLQPVKQALEQMLATLEDPPPSQIDVTRRLGYTESYLARNFPELWGQIANRYQTYHTAKKLRLQHALEATLARAEEPPPSGNKVAKRLGSCRTYLQHNFPHLYSQISQRFHAYRAARKRSVA